MSWKLELWVEGPTDAVTHRRWEQAEGSEEPGGAAKGALIPLVRGALAATPPLTEETLHRVLPEERMTAHRLSWKVRERVALGGGGRGAPLSHYARKVMMAIDKARRADPDTLIVAVRDLDGDEERLRDRDGLHDLLRRQGQTGVVIAVCVQAVEAWLLADAAAFRRCFKRGPQKGIPGAPEGEPKPKEKLQEVFAELEVDGADLAATYRALADKVDVETLTRSCPRGFGELRKALREMIVACLSSPSPGA